MEENKKIRNEDNSSVYIYTVLIILGMAVIAFASVYIPFLIFAMLIIAPFAMRYDMEAAKPILSIALAVICGIFLAFNSLNYSVFYILTAATGLSVAISFVIWRFAKIEKFSVGMKYALLGSAFIGVMIALVVFLIGGREPFSLQIVNDVEKFFTSGNSQSGTQMLDALYNRMIMLEKEGQMTFSERLQSAMGILDYSKGVALGDKVDKVMPLAEAAANTYSILAILFYPAIAGGLAWWRGSYRFYKDKEMTDSVKNMKPMPFATFTIPRGLFGLVVSLLLLSFILQVYQSSDMMMYAAMTMQYFSYLLLGIQGLAVAEYFLKRVKIFKFAALRITLMIIVGIISVGIFFLFIGMIDLFFNTRLVYAKTKEMKEKMARMKETQEQQKKDETENENKDENKDQDKNDD
ncbi:MAG: DUF2232 domain-containing protein [Eubacteriales bacterium]